jgi:hypothetical protein
VFAVYLEGPRYSQNPVIQSTIEDMLAGYRNSDGEDLIKGCKNRQFVLEV